MKSLSELLDGWQDGSLSDDELRQLDSLLSTVEGRAGFVCEMQDRAVIIEALRSRGSTPGIHVDEPLSEEYVSESPLQSGDVVRTGSESGVKIVYQREATWIELASGTEVELSESPEGKRIVLRIGRLEAQVAPQPVGRPMVCLTPTGRATVLGTHFCLTATENQTRLEVQRGEVRLDNPDQGPPADVRQGHSAQQANDTIDVRPLVENGKYEAESLLIAEEQHGRAYIRRELGKASGDYHRDFAPSQSGGSLTLQLPVEIHGRYRVIIGASKLSNRGIYQLAIADSLNGSFVDQGSPRDYFGRSGYTYEEFDLGTATFGSREGVFFRFTCLGKREMSGRRSQYQSMKLGVDYIRLIPVGVE